MKYLAAVLVAATACGSSTHGPRTIDLTVDTFEGATLLNLQYRDGGGTWLQPARNDDGTYALTVTDAYEVFAVYEGNASGTFIDEIEELRATVDDPPPAIAPVDLWRAYHRPEFHVSGQVVGGGSIWVETPAGEDIPSPSWSMGEFMIDAFPTSHYLYVLGTYNGPDLATIVRRSFEPGHDTNIGLINFISEARPLVTQPVQIANAVSGGLSNPYADVAGPGRVPLRQSSAVYDNSFNMPLLPSEMRQDDDHYTATVSAKATRTSQTYRNTDAATLSAPITLMSPVEVSFLDNPVTATWAIDDRDAELYGSNSAVEHRVRATAGWLADVGATSLAIHEDVPGFNPDWRLYNLNHIAMALTLSTATPTTVNSVTMSN
jgi:hypothetical protein